MNEHSPLVAVVMGSASDREQMSACSAALDRFGIAHETRILSAHRTPVETTDYAASLESRGVRVVVAGAGMAAHLAGVFAAHTGIPVIGVPLASGPLGGLDALLSTVQMPGGVPVATVGIGSSGAENAAYLAARILALVDSEVGERVAQVLEEDAARARSAGGGPARPDRPTPADGPHR